MSQPAKERRKTWTQAVLTILFLVFCSSVVVLIRDNDLSGWISHTKNIDIYMSGDWLVGENRNCRGVQNRSDGSRPFIASIYCPEDVETKISHNVPVRFWGRVSRPDATLTDEVTGIKDTWQCIRESDSFVCKAIN
jgi:hypothetical protein